LWIVKATGLGVRDFDLLLVLDEFSPRASQLFKITVNS